MIKGFKKWVIDVVPPIRNANRRASLESGPPRKVDAQSHESHKGSLRINTKTAFAKAVFVTDFVSESLESVLDSDGDPVAELVKAGATLKEFRVKNLELRKRFKTNYKSNNKEEIGQDFGKIINQIQIPITNRQDLFKQVLPVEMAKPEQTLVGYIKSEQIIISPEISITMGTIADAIVPMVKFLPKKSYWKLFMLLLGILSFVIYGLGLKDEVVKNSESALRDIKVAQANFEKFNFNEAADSFKKSYESFSQANRNLNLTGAGILGLLGDIPGTGKFKSAKNLIVAGKFLASSGQSMSEALGVLSQTGSILNPNETNKIKPSKAISQLKRALELSNKNFNKAKALLLDVDDSIVPEDKKGGFVDFKEKLPIIEGLLSDAYKYTDFLEGIIGVDEYKKYLILFNNYSELRPVGGFPGTYGVVSFSNGGLDNLFVDDVYNLDGQLKRKVIPPKQIQHITPTWGMRDAAWFIDFPTSARKTMSFFTEEAGHEVDGVIALNPDIISHLLKVVGPIEMPEYKVTLTADNFLVNIQEEVEYGENRTQPKTIIIEFMPRLLERLYSAGSEQWMEIFKELMISIEEKDIIFYFEDRELEKFVIDENFGGEIKNTDSDFLTVNLSNIKGSKTDIVIDSFINIDAREEGDQVIHKVIITRKHKGGDHEHGFYNRQNPTYVRVLIPEDAKLLSVSGNDLLQHEPLVNYQNSDFEKDKDLVRFESGFDLDESNGVNKFKESDKKGIGFWMVTDPGATKTVRLEYSVPTESVQDGFYFQKQPGLNWKNFKFKWNGSNLVNMELKKDLEISIKLQ